jgi:hypothetical protein
MCETIRLEAAMLVSAPTAVDSDTQRGDGAMSRPGNRRFLRGNSWSTTRRSSRVELGERAYRSLFMENTGTQRRRIWWIVSADILAECSVAA